jgi:hypothetical protein
LPLGESADDDGAGPGALEDAAALASGELPEVDFPLQLSQPATKARGTISIKTVDRTTTSSD